MRPGRHRRLRTPGHPSLDRLRQRRRPRSRHREGTSASRTRTSACPQRRATKANIMDRIQLAVRAAEPGDVLVFYYSGHGSQIRDRDGDELADSLDEVICPYDMDWDSNTFILDDDLDEILSRGTRQRRRRDVRRLLLLGRPGRARPNARSDSASGFSHPRSTSRRVRRATSTCSTTMSSPDASASLGGTCSGPPRPRGRSLPRTIRGSDARRLHLLGLPVHGGQHRANPQPRVQPPGAHRGSPRVPALARIRAAAGALGAVGSPDRAAVPAGRPGDRGAGRRSDRSTHASPRSAARLARPATRPS